MYEFKKTLFFKFEDIGRIPGRKSDLGSVMLQVFIESLSSRNQVCDLTAFSLCSLLPLFIK